MPESTYLPLDLYWLLLLWIAIWGGVTSGMAYLAGWPRLAERFRAMQDVEGERFRFVSGSIGSPKWLPVRYRRCLFLTVADDGLFISVFFLFRALSPPLFIPWNAVETLGEKRIWIIDHTVIYLRGFSTVIMVSGQARQSITRSYERFSNQRRT